MREALTGSDDDVESQPRGVRAMYAFRPVTKYDRQRRHSHKARQVRTGLRLEPLESRTLLAGGPRILSITPTQVINATFDHVDVAFNEPIDPTTFTTSDVSLTGPSGSASLAIDAVVELDSATYRITFPALTTRGAYSATIGPDIADLAGNDMDQNQDGVNGDPVKDVFKASLLYISASMIFTSPVTISEGNTTYDGQDIAIDGTTVTINGSHNFNSLHLVHEAIVTHSANTATQTQNLDLTVTQQVIVDPTSRIDVSGKGYLPGRTTGNTTVGAATGGTGASYGGTAWTGGTGTTNATYGDYADPSEPGSGGAGGAGGGLVRITAAALTLDGQILASGTDGGPGAGGGSGGGVYVAVTTLRGSGLVVARGAGGGSGGSGGGRVAVYAKDASGFDTSHITVPGAGRDGGTPGGVGTLYLRNPDEPYGTLILGAGYGGGWTPLVLPGQNAVTISDSVVIQGGDTHVRPEHAGMALSIQNGLTIDSSSMQAEGVTVSGAMLVNASSLIVTTITASSLTVSGGSVVTTYASSPSQVYKLSLTIAGALAVDATSKIDVSGKGYLPGRTTGNTTVGAATGGTGASYGGTAWTGGTGTTNATYGDYADPSEPGSGGAGGAGGGLVRITAAALTLDGQILASGTDGGPGAGGGSGGGVYVAVTTLRGSGLVVARGAGGGSGGSGGGRVAV